jgi:3',5'-cyclic AMP phosphodiesterase CpdA
MSGAMRFALWAVLVAAAPVWERVRRLDAPARLRESAPASAGTPVKVVIFGDTRGRALLEVWRRDLSEERRVVLEAIAQERPAAVFHTGDLVFDAASPECWQQFDREHAAVRAAGVPYFVAWGNHEYVGRRERALGHLRARFPEAAEQHWRTVRIAQTLFVLVDTNYEQLGAAADDQDAWLVRTLESAERSAAVAQVFVIGHHPPFTNGKRHGPDLEVRHRLWDRARRYGKVRALWFAHVHAYERFVVDGRHVVVTGGGGAPPHDVAAEGEVAAAYDGGRGRGPHYCVVTLREDGAEVAVRMLGATGWYEAERFSIEVPAR